MKQQSSLDDAARRLTNGHYVEQTMPGIDTSDVSEYLRRHKEQLKPEQSMKKNPK
ncbi:hypothetical protein DFQ01_110105 [Paenibacillus cellulosilyticus]|uniref:Uncharacterized protein n=1 Tax=Paenibacillus cellulosilyticus TaxID=375489 RepID=A0A2V2Z1G7_9BACL|nr:hypothetical protein [Paenibacillus cellulosilyticus]PWW01215.1 hypothetical protein DFQ01_110105 [Paenibacillus cellulosilyticus]QKS46830.1 hypothetical protein HUB94_20315 [Paenibacillus cellulosilyticus]